VSRLDEIRARLEAARQAPFNPLPTPPDTLQDRDDLAYLLARVEALEKVRKAALRIHPAHQHDLCALCAALSAAGRDQ
jgi:hypothetical protein